ncbi:uncharacterized protein LOC129572595 isoform X2 [Sitodiplosis mosellana]|uniref:uncharacterized protein LOC129572595 isoform X2 n=1 Tax=Sitodiplosis mosellana TaxID=263140 RepID=UPI002443C531|nr:uncharacterized protein LOC129572595 isoform X2 [Sitodiplosis mosellana]
MESVDSIQTVDHQLSINPQPLNITSIDDDVKILIFEFLAWPDLLSVAETSKTLHTAACDVYKRKYGKGRLQLTYFDGSLGSAPDILVWNHVKALKILRNFGHVVSDILLHIESTNNHCFHPTLLIHIESYVAKYCSKSLRRFRFVKFPRFLFKENQNSFINVERIDFSYCLPLCNIPFSTIFPNLKYIQCFFLPLRLHGSIPVSIPSVKKLSIYAILGGPDRDLNLEKNCIDDLLKLNPQIEDLELALYNEFKEVNFQNFRENLPMLKRFILQMYFNDIDQCYHFDSVVDFEMRSMSYIETGPTNIPFTFSKLEHFKYDCCFDKTIASCIFDFLTKNKHLKSITLDGVRDENNTAIKKLFQLESVLTNIEELSIRIVGEKMTSDLLSEHILNLFSKSQSLKKLNLTCYRTILDNLNDSVKLKIVKQKGRYFNDELTITLHPQRCNSI